MYAAGQRVGGEEGEEEEAAAKLTESCSRDIETEDPWKLATDARRPRCTMMNPDKSGVRVLLAENTRNTSEHFYGERES